MKLSDESLQNINGGISGWAVAGIISAVVFASGAIDGWARPPKCRN